MSTHPNPSAQLNHPHPSHDEQMDSLLYSYMESAAFLAAADGMLPELLTLDTKRQEMLLDWLDSRVPEHSSTFELALAEAMEEAGIGAVAKEKRERVERWKLEWEMGKRGKKGEGGLELRELVEVVDDMGRDCERDEWGSGKRKREEGDEKVDVDGDARKPERECKRRWVGSLTYRGRPSGGSGT